jgi:membrane-bound lytic murein transglycosylase D
MTKLNRFAGYLFSFGLGLGVSPLAGLLMNWYSNANLRTPQISTPSRDNFDFPEASNNLEAPFWENSGFDPLFAELGLDEILNIDQEESPKITEESLDRILIDFQSRLNPQFKIPELIFNQTKFWFRIYTEFDSTKKVVHDSLHPHIIYDVIDISEILEAPSKAKWLNVQKANKTVSHRVAQIRSKLKNMASKKIENFDDQEQMWWEQLQTVKGARQKVLKTAAASVRVQTGQKNFFENGLTLSGRYIEGMEQLFAEKKLPIELTRLPFVESSFVIGATSKVGAAGIWQFMPGIGRKFMLVNDQFDERRNPWKSTRAAAQLLKENHQILHKNWGLALTAYNHGPGGVRKAMQATGSKDIAKIVRQYRSRNFDFASANFYTCFLAALHAYTYRDMIWPDHIIEPTLVYEKVKLNRSSRVRDLLLKSNLKTDEFLAYNPELDRSLRRNDLLPKGYQILLPPQAAEMFLQSVASIEKSSHRPL